jgi:hypothetical protein
MADELPATVEAAVQYLRDKLSKEDLARLAAMTEDDLIGLHFGLGLYVRNQLGLWGGNKSLLEATGAWHPDDASGVIINALWRHVRGSEPADDRASP